MGVTNPAKKLKVTLVLSQLLSQMKTEPMGLITLVINLWVSFWRYIFMEKGFDQIYFYQGKCLQYHRSSPISLATLIPLHQLISLQAQGKTPQEIQCGKRRQAVRAKGNVRFIFQAKQFCVSQKMLVFTFREREQQSAYISRPLPLAYNMKKKT